MRSNLQTSNKIELNFVDKQPCVKAMRSAEISLEWQREAERFIKRNLIPECKRVSPSCFKAHLIKTAKTLKLSPKKVNKIKQLFKARIGYKGYYLDNNTLKHV